MQIGLTQLDIKWEDKETSKTRCLACIQAAKKAKVDLLVFPEMALTGFTMNVELAGEEMLGSPTIKFFREESLKNHMAIAFGYVESFGGEYYNKMAIVSEGKLLYDYDKIHPFSYGEEGKYYTGGNQVETASLDGLTFSGFICYDLRFPEIFQVVSKETDVILIIANWPAERIEHWETLLKARAIENQCYIVGVNRIGKGGGHTYRASSMAFDPDGKRMTRVGNQSNLLTVQVTHETVEKARTAFPVKKDRKESLYASWYQAEQIKPVDYNEQ